MPTMCKWLFLSCLFSVKLSFCTMRTQLACWSRNCDPCQCTQWLFTFTDKALIWNLACCDGQSVGSLFRSDAHTCTCKTTSPPPTWQPNGHVLYNMDLHRDARGMAGCQCLATCIWMDTWGRKHGDIQCDNTTTIWIMILHVKTWSNICRWTRNTHKHTFSHQQGPRCLQCLPQCFKNNLRCSFEVKEFHLQRLNVPLLGMKT